MTNTRGYFGIGVEGISKPMNLGNLMRSANAFGANFFFTVNSPLTNRDIGSDTSNSRDHVPLWQYNSPSEIQLPIRCVLVGVEFSDSAINLPSFPHPISAAYVLGPEKGSLSAEITGICEYIVKIPTSFCINVGVAGAIVMYDRLASQGRFTERPLNPSKTLKTT